jgi:hypothetical protein
MERPGEHSTTDSDAERLLCRLGKMEASGRITGEEAEGVRTADPGEVDEATRAIRLRHARERLEGDVRDGRTTQDEADVILQRLADGEHPRLLLDLPRRRRSR